MSSFEQTPEQIHSRKMRPACDNVYRRLFGKDIKIKRFEKESERFILDKEFAIDVILEMPTGIQLTGQEKALRNYYYKYKTFTIELYNNRNSYPVGKMEAKEKGEWFNISAQFYLSGYSNIYGDGFVEWVFMDMLKFVKWINSTFTLEQLKKKSMPSSSNASFIPFEYSKIPKECFYARSILNQ